MFGRVRSPTSSPDSLERPTAKLLKHDSLSVYEATLLKLKVGAAENQRATKEVGQAHDNSAVSSPCGDAVDMDADCSCSLPVCLQDSPSHIGYPKNVNDAEVCSPVGSIAVSTGNPKQQKCSNVSILYYFSKHKTTQNVPSNNYMEMMENNCLPSLLPPCSGKPSNAG